MQSISICGIQSEKIARAVSVRRAIAARPHGSCFLIEYPLEEKVDSDRRNVEQFSFVVFCTFYLLKDFRVATLQTSAKFKI